MAESSNNASNLLQELRNRRVFRVAAVYLGVGYAILEASSIIVPMLGFSDLIVKIILAVLVAGFPLATILAWMFQLTPEGLRRSPRTGEKQTADEKPLTSNASIVFLLVVIVALLAYQSFAPARTNPTGRAVALALDPKSVAVLPFTPFTKTMEDESFADGVHDDILTQLSKIADLKVISRTSVMQYKGTTMLVSDIANELGVSNILEGSVRRAGDQIRIVAQLINAETDEHLWAETYDRQYADIFSVQSDVAKKIANALKAKLTPQEKQYIETKPTENQKAWELYLRGQLLNDADVVDKDSVAVYFNQAIELDPDFLLPHTKLVRIHAYKYFDGSGEDPTSERLTQARDALDRALKINHDAPETRIAQGYYHYYGSRNYNAALEEFSAAQQAQPNNSDLFAAIAYVERRLGQYDQSLKNLQKAVSLDPNDAAKVEETRNWAYRMKEWELSQRYQDQLSAIHSGNEASVEIGQYWLETARSGDLNKMQAVLDRLLLQFKPSELFDVTTMQAFCLRDFEACLNITMADTNSSAWDIGFLLEYTGKHEEAQAYFDSARIEAEQAIKENPEDWLAYGELGSALAKLGQYEEAIKWGKKEVEIMSLARDGLNGGDALEDLAEIYMFCGEIETAIELYEQIMELPQFLNASFLKLDPTYDPLRSHPRFLALLGESS